MKRNIVWIIIVVVIVALFWYFCDNQKKQLENERDIALMERDQAIAVAVAEALELAKSRGVAKEPPVRTKIVYVEKEAPKEKKAKKPANTFTDNRDGKQYKYIEVEGQLWMAQNLDFESSDSWCYNEDPLNCEIGGRMYTWTAATQACPEGWRLPSDEDWDNLIWRFGGKEVAGRHLKEGGDSDFNVLMAGYRDKKGFYGKSDTSAYFWSSSEQNDKYASFRGFYKEFSNIGPYTYTKTDGFTVRCVKDK